MTQTSDPRLLAVEFIFGIMLREPQVQAMANMFSEVPTNIDGCLVGSQ